jgi:hypothetical protein
VSFQCKLNLTLTKEVKVNREHLLFGFIVFFEARQRKNMLQFCFLVVADIEQQIVVMVRYHRSQKSAKLQISNFHLFTRHCVSEDALPDIVVILIHVPD